MTRGYRPQPSEADRAGPQRGNQRGRAVPSAAVDRPLLAVDGDSFAHRAYHAIPKSVRHNAVIGFTNMIVRLWDQEQPRAVTRMACR